MITTITARIRARANERDSLLMQLDCWASALRAGFAVEDVEAFTFRPAYTPKMTQSKWLLCRAGLGISAETHHNAVRLVDGTVQPIFPVKRPAIL